MLRFADGIFVMPGCARERFAGEKLNGMNFGRYDCWRRGVRGLVAMTVIVIFEIFENVADVEESVAIEADIDESGLHARKDAGDFTFVDAADEGELFFALDVNFD